MAYQRLLNYKPPGRGKGSRLTTKQTAFIDEYMVCGVAKDACLKAGYKTKNPTRMGTELLAHPLVKAEINRRKQVRTEKSELTIDFLVQKLLEIIQDEQDENPTAALRAIELAGKHLGMYKERQEISGPDGNAIEIQEQRVKQSAHDFTSKLAELAKRGKAAEDNIIPIGRKASGE